MLAIRLPFVYIPARLSGHLVWLHLQFQVLRWLFQKEKLLNQSATCAARIMRLRAWARQNAKIAVRQSCRIMSALLAAIMMVARLPRKRLHRTLPLSLVFSPSREAL